VKGARDLALPPLLVETLPDGLQLVSIERRGLPLFHARISLPAGAGADPRGKTGLAQFTVDLLRRGTQKRSAQGVDDLVEGMGAHLSADVSMDEAALSISVPSELREQALDALLEVALSPAFAPEEVASARRRALAALQSDLDEPGTVAGRAVLALGFGAEHPYGHPSHGYKRDVETFQRADVAAFHAAHYRSRGALVTVVGDASPLDLSAFVRERLARWEHAFPRSGPGERTGASVAALPESPAFPAGPPRARERTQALVIHKPDSTQAQVRFVAPGLAKRSPRYAEAVVANTALGGGFTSLLVDAIRVDRGLSYSVSTRLPMYRNAGLTTFASFTKNETLRALIDLALEKMRGYAAAGPGPDALDKARTYLAGLFPLGLESHEALAEQVSDALLDGVGLEHLAHYRSRILGVTLEQARSAAAELSPGREGTQIVVVGDGEVARKALEGLCPIEVKPIEEFG
jgi:zinc protease